MRFALIRRSTPGEDRNDFFAEVLGRLPQDPRWRDNPVREAPTFEPLLVLRMRRWQQFDMAYLAQHRLTPLDEPHCFEPYKELDNFTDGPMNIQTFPWLWIGRKIRNPMSNRRGNLTIVAN